jgi:sortase A
MNAEKRKAFSFSLMAVGLMLLLIAMGLLCYNLWVAYQADQSAQEVLAVLDELIPETDPSDQDGTDAQGTGAGTNGSGTIYVPTGFGTSQQDGDETSDEMKSVKINNYSYIGRIEVPSLGLNLPVMDQWSYPRLRVSPCRYSGTAAGGDLIILAHNYPRHFGTLKNLDIGATVIFTDVDGRVYRYQVAEIQTLEKTDTLAMEAGDWDLTMFTCTIGGQYRVTVRCVAEEENNA